MAAQPTVDGPRRVTLVTDELLGYTRTGGIGTATTFLALALARGRHEVDVLYTGGDPHYELAQEWAGTYESFGVRVRALPRTSARVEPPYFARLLDVERALGAGPPDVVIAQDLAAPVYTALRMRSLGLAFERTLFVVYCHGGRRWITDMARKVRVLPGAHAITLLEQASVELADVVVSPSTYLLDWMRMDGWDLPQRALVIPHVSRSVALAEPTPPPRPPNGQPIERIAFFGRLEDRKGLRPFAAGVNALDPELLARIELEFIGRETPAWPRKRIEGLLSDRARRALRRISFATELDQPEALARLGRPGTLAVMPSFGETFSNAVFECLEHGIPFIASSAGAPKELIDPLDHPRVLFEPTPTGVADALRRALSDASSPEPARRAFDPQTAVEQWGEVMQLEAKPRERSESIVSAVDVVRRGRQQAIKEATSSSTSEWLLVMDDEAVADDELVTTLRRAQAASQADVVTCGVRLSSGVDRLFFGDPGGLGILGNHYGTAALIRRSLLRDAETRWPPDQDVYWPLLARLSLEGAKIVSVPRALVRQPSEPGDVGRTPADALLVADEFERHLPPALRSLARLTAGLAAAPGRTAAPQPRRLLRRLLG